MAGFTHLGSDGAARMVDVGAKPASHRIAVAGGHVKMHPDTLAALAAGSLAKGEVLQVARVAGIQAAKRTGDLIPLCHPLGLDAVHVAFQRRDDRQLDVYAAARLTARTGVEMEALTAVTVAALTVYDMCKAVDKSMQIGGVRLLFKAGGKAPFCSMGGAVAASGGSPRADEEVSLLWEPPSPEAAPEGGWAVLRGIPAALLPADLWLVFENGVRAELVAGGAMVLGDAALPPAETKVVVRLGDSYGG